jgi:hypothetical protein
MHLAAIAFNTAKHLNSNRCRTGAIRKQKRMAALFNKMARTRTIQVSGEIIEQVDVFRYLGRPMSADDNDRHALYHNLRKAQQRWAMVSRVLTREGATPKISAMFYKAVCMSVLLFSSETWVLTEDIIGKLTSFHHRVARRITRRHPRPAPDGDEWIYPSITQTLAHAKLYPLREYLQKRKSYLLQYANSHHFYQQCRELGDNGLLSQRRRYWWSNDHH